jgi:hypothetical protein
MVLAGTVIRPAGSDSYWPPVGTTVNWRACAAIQMMYDQANAWDVLQLGVIGNTGHLQKHGDHTPWSAGKVRGIVYAIDLDMPDAFGPWLIAKCKSNYNTLFIDFFNFRNQQYGQAGQPFGYNPDHHLHMSIQVGHENDAVNIINDFFMEQDMPITDADAEKIALAVINHSVPRPTNLNYKDASGKVANPTSWGTSGATGTSRFDYMIHLITSNVQDLANAFAKFATAEAARDATDTTQEATNKAELLAAVKAISVGITDDQLNTMSQHIAQAVVAADNGLSGQDLEGVKSAVKTALREGAGAS